MAEGMTGLPRDKTRRPASTRSALRSRSAGELPRQLTSPADPNAIIAAVKRGTNPGRAGSLRKLHCFTCTAHQRPRRALATTSRPPGRFAFQSARASSSFSRNFV